MKAQHTCIKRMMMVLGLVCFGAFYQGASAAEYEGQAEVAVYAKNMEAARKHALLKAKRHAIWLASRQLIHPALFKKRTALLRKKVLPLHMRLIHSFRVLVLEPSFDQKTYRAVVAANIPKAPLERVLREVGLLVVDRGVDKLVLDTYYLSSDLPLAQFAQLRQVTFARIAQRLRALGFEVSATPKAVSASQVRELTASQNGNGVVVVRTARGWGFGTRPWQITLRVYAPNQGGLIGQFTQRHANSALTAPWDASAQSAWARLMLEPLTKQMQAQSLSLSALQGANQKGSNTLQVRVVGLHSAEEENIFLSQFFNNTRYIRRVRMVGLQGNTLEYVVNLRVGVNSWLAYLKRVKPTHFSLTALRLSADKTSLEMALSPKSFNQPSALQLFPAYRRPHSIARKLQMLLETAPPLKIGDPQYREVEDNSWYTKPNRVPFNVSLYGQIDSRADLDMYLVEAVKPKQTVQILWLQVGRTQLRPEIRIYNLKRELLLSRRVSDWAKITFKVPRHTRAFYLQVGDLHGYIPGEIGGYLRYDYLLKVRRP